jgi:hypothetical protein
MTAPRGHPGHSTTAALVLLGSGCAALSLVLLTVAAVMPGHPRTASHAVLLLSLTVPGCLAAITAEALCLARTWGSLASRALLVACCAALVGNALLAGLRHGLVVAAVVIVIAIGLGVPIVTYVDEQLASGSRRGPRSRPFP